MAKKKKKSNFWIWAILVLLVLAIPFLIFGKKQGWFGASKKVKVSVQEIKRRDIIETVKASGKIYPILEVKISSDVSGEIKNLYVSEGDTAHQGMLLAEIDDEIYRSAVERANASLQNMKANVSNSKARLNQSRSNLAKLKNDFERSKLLYAEKVISRIEYENAEAAFISSEADVEAGKQRVEAAKFNVESATANLKEANDNLNRTKLFAPMAGIISVLNVEKGERVVGTIQMTGTELMRIADFDKMEVRVDVSENDVLRVAKNDRVEIEVDAYTDKIFKGKVTSIASSAQGINSISQDQVTNFTVKILIDKSSYASIIKKRRGIPFRPGMSASVEIETEKASNIVAAPVQAITTRIADEDALKEELEEVVFINLNGKAEKRIVKTGVQDEQYIQIISGIAAGDEIIEAPFRTINKKLEGGEELNVVDKDKLFEEE